MDKLQQQCTCFEAIKKLCENYKKDSASRKTKDYLENKLTSLESQWKDFEERHGALLIEISDKNIPYFSETVFEKLKIIADSTKTNMMHLLKQLQAAETKPVNFDLSGLLEDATDETLSRLLNKQECNFKAIDRVMSKIDIQSINEKWELEDSLGLLKSKWEAIDKLHWELENLLNGSNENYHRLFVSVEDKYDEMKKDLNRKIWSTVHYQQSAPRIEIPEFSGSYSQWNSFKDIFIETIHSNPTINKAQKMQHLKTKLRGEAEKLVQHLAISAENYESCWEILNHRFENRRLQFTSFMNTMLNLPTIQHPDAQKLKRMHDVITECLNGLSNMGIDTATWDPMIVHLMSQKLMETSLYGEYVKELHDHREIPNLNEFLSFLEGKFMAFETMGTTKKETANSSNQHSSKTFNKQYPLKKLNYYEYKKLTPKSYHTVYGQCLLCDGKHVLMQCPKFVSAEPRERKSIVAKLQVCKNCLYSHGHLECKSTKTCKECNMKHHTLLHYVTAAAGSNSTPNYIGKNQPPQRTHNSPQQQQASNHLSNTDTEILLTTVQLKVKTIDGTYVPLRALLDQGSQVNLISENAAQLLKLHRRKLTATITGIGSVSGDCKGKLQLTSKSIHNDFSFDFEALIMKKLTNNLPNSSFNKANWPHLENLKLADPDYNVSRSVDVLLGADVYSKIILDGVLRGGQQAPIAQQTHLGWILCGKLQTFNCHATLIDVNELTKFWECEDITQGNDDSSKDDQCEKHYAETVQRGPDGKYTVKMPMVPNFEENLGNSKSIAISQFLQLERRLERNKKLALMYRDFIKEYADMGHLKPSLQQSKSECYLPHHGVLKEHSTTTKLRVVFNASQKTTSGFSLNNLQEKGANLQKDIQALIIKWRVYKYAYTADIEKMFRAIWVAEEQQALQKIIWRDSPREKLQELQLCTVTYGTKSAPWLAMRTLLQLALDDKQKYPAAAEILQKEVFVDDLISGHNSLDEAKKLQHELINLLRGGGMNLRKWSSNHPALLEDLTSDQLSTKNIFDFKTEDTTKTLGLGWNPHDDIFVMNWSLELGTESQITKRYLLSEISKLYDPLGWFSPITIKAKLLFQQVWMSKHGWDDNLPKPIQQEWLKLKAEMTQLKTVKLNRWLGGTQNNLELLGFCDASEKAYSCVIYSRVINEEGMPVITLLVAKTRVSPLAQKTTLPRLELCGALLLSQLIEKTKQALSGYTITVRAWSDSQVVLAWLQGEASRWETYVANRTAKIKKQIPAEQWHYVRSEENPADCASRGLYPSKLVNYSLWWEGPDFLKTDETQCSDKQEAACLFSTNLESANHTQLRGQTNKPCESIISELLHKHSSYTRAKRIIAWILRFINNVRVKTKPETTYLTTSELLAANNEIIKCAQKSDFAFEYKLLQKNDSVPSSSSVYKLNPYMDSNGIIRVGGRLNNSTLPPEMKNPIILSRNGRLTQLLIQHAHLSTLHGGARLTLSYIRQRYWIVSGNRAVKTQLRHCVQCHRHKPAKNTQLMGDLPRQRISPSRPFTHTGVDFTGHVEVKLNKGRGVKTSKGYIAIFVCMATKAVHIELVSDMTTETFLAAFQRMCARRGTPKHMYSDCGTNFIGASKVLRNEFQEFKQALTPEFFDEIGKLEVEWHFNAPAWPTAGGLWEAAVKAMKYHLRRVLGDQKLTYEEFTTLLTRIEACMNSRPLCPLTEDPDEFYNYLTPGHFLTGGPTMSLPISDYTDVRDVDIRRRWQLTEHMLQRFWRTWSSEYLNQLQARTKWQEATKNLKEGDIVLVKEDNLPPGKWAMARVIKLHPGRDGLVRVTTVKTQTTTMKRPIVKLSPLPINCEQEISRKQDQDAERSPTTPPPSPKRGARKSNPLMLAAVTTIFTLLISGSQAAPLNTDTHITYTSFEPERPIYYDTVGGIQLVHNEWNLLMYYNLTTYWDGTRNLLNYLGTLKDLCAKMDQRFCKSTLEQLYHEMDLLNHYNAVLLAPHKEIPTRRKRGLIDGVGYVANGLFGILDQRFAEKYQQDIEAIQGNEHYLLELVKNQTSIVQVENDVLKKNEDNLRRQFTYINTVLTQTNMSLGKIENVIETVTTANYFATSSFTAYLILTNLERIQEMLLNTINNIYQGHLDVHLFTPANLIKQLSEIAGRLPRTLSLPVNDVRGEIKDIYKLLHVKARITETYFLCEIHIPLIGDEDFTLYRIIPLPIKTQENATKLIQVSTAYIAVNFRKNTYMSMQHEDLKRCTQRSKDNFICRAILPVHNLHYKNAPCEAKLIGQQTALPCEMRSASCKDYWIELHSPNTWLHVCCDKCSLRSICNNDVSLHATDYSGILTLKQGCMVQARDTTIYSKNQFSSNVKMEPDLSFYAPLLNNSINRIVNLTIHGLPELSQPDKWNLSEVDKRLALQRTSELHLPSKISTHDIHQYVISYCLLAAGFTAFGIWILKRRCPDLCKKRVHVSAQFEDIELKAIPRRNQRTRKSDSGPSADNIAFNFE